MDIDTLKQSLKPLVDASIARGDFTLTSGKKSTYYIDGKLVTLDQKGAHLCAQILFAMLQGMEDVTAIGGPVVGANPIVSTLGHVCFERGRPLKMFYIRKEPKKHGTQKWLEGPAIEPGEKALILEDVITTAGTVLKSVEKVQESGVEVVKVICIVDRQEGGSEALREMGIDFTPIFTISEFDVK